MTAKFGTQKKVAHRSAPLRWRRIGKAPRVWLVLKPEVTERQLIGIRFNRHGLCRVDHIEVE